MNKYLIIFFAAFSMNLFSQEITFTPRDTVLNGELNDEIIFYIDVHNVSADTQTVFVVRTQNDLPEGWTSSLCFDVCFAPFLDSIATVPEPPYSSEPLAPGEIREVSLHVFTSDNYGTAYVQLQAGTFSDPDTRHTVNFEMSAFPTSVNDEQAGINGFSLEQNYPNPFNPATNLKFQIAEFGFVTLKVFDVLGNEIAVLVNEVKEPGTYEIKFSSADYNLAGGIYFYRLTSNNFSQTNKMVLNK